MLRTKKWPWKAEMRSPREQRMRMTASQPVGLVRLRRSSAASLRASLEGGLEGSAADGALKPG